MPLDRQNHNAGAWRGRSPHRPAPQLPAFCRTRRPTSVAVTPSSLASLRALVLLGVAFQLSTLLLVTRRARAAAACGQHQLRLPLRCRR